MSKETCPRCSRPVQEKFRFCPYCSCNLENEREMRDFGLLGKEDSSELFSENFGINLNMNDIFSSMNAIMKDLSKDLGKERPFSKAISIKLSPGKKPVVETKGFSNNKKDKTADKKKIKIQEFPEACRAESIRFDSIKRIVR